MNPTAHYPSGKAVLHSLLTPIVGLLLLLLPSSLTAQRVGLVLAGGGAKGIAHVGLIQALEENNIPIDYISGTSIGAIVGSLYAIGYSPQEMMNLFLSEEFRKWQTGEIEKKQMLYYKQKDPTPEIVQFKLNFQDSTKLKYFLPTSIVNPSQMNIAFVKLYAQAIALSEGSFDNLFIPFRCIASDTYRKRPITFDRGDLGIAVRASMSIPILFKPLRIDSILFFDGGIYDNFPLKTMQHDFNPDYIIGSTLAPEKERLDDRDWMGQLETIVINISDFDLTDDKGILIMNDMAKVGMMSFDMAQEAFNIGYTNGLKYVDQIRKKVTRRISPETLNLQRTLYKGQFNNLVIGAVTIDGVKPAIKSYIQGYFNSYKESIPFEEFERIYFSLLSDSKLTEIMPSLSFNPTTKKFDLQLQVSASDDISAGFGGIVSSMNSNQGYFGVSYQSIFYTQSDYHLDAHIGNNYNSLALSGRMIFPTRLPFYILAQGVMSYNKFSDGERLFFEEELPTYFRSNEYFLRLRFGMPIANTHKMEATASYGRMDDSYAASRMQTVANQSIYQFFNTSILTEKNTLNGHMHPYKGGRLKLKGQYAIGSETLKNANRQNDSIQNKHYWIQLSANWENYFRLQRNFYLGTEVYAHISNKPFFENYTATIIQTPGFTPTTHSQVVFNESLRAMNLAAVGIKPVYRFDNGIQLRGEFYGILPYQRIMRSPEGYAYHAKPFSYASMMGELSVVYALPILSIALYANTYSYPKWNFNFGVNIGIFLRNPKFLD